MNLLTKQKEIHRLRKRTNGCCVEGTNREFGMDMYTWITKGLLYSTGNTAQCCVAAWMGKEFGGEWIRAYSMAEFLCC